MKVIKPRNAGTMTEWAFRSMISNLLRRKSIQWKPIGKYKKSKQIPYVWDNKHRKYSYICEECWWEFDWSQVDVNHIIPVWKLTCEEDLPSYFKRLFAEEWFNLLCKWCHKKETSRQLKDR